MYSGILAIHGMVFPNGSTSVTHMFFGGKDGY